MDRSLLSELSNDTGFASEINNLLNAFIYTVATHRHLFIDAKEWNYDEFDTYFDMDIGQFASLLPNSSISKLRKFVYSKESTVFEHRLRTSRDLTGSVTLLNTVEQVRNKQNLTRLGTIEIKRHVPHYL